jgi:hypothetical protein
MSVVIALIPVALAVAASAAARRRAEEEGHVALAIQTRMKDGELIVRALEMLGCEAELDASGVRATRNQFEFTFSRGEDGVLEARFGPDVAPDEAEMFVHDLDHEYTRLVQERVHRRVIERAREYGLTLESEEVEDDDSILLTLRAEEGGSA